MGRRDPQVTGDLATSPSTVSSTLSPPAWTHTGLVLSEAGRSVWGETSRTPCSRSLKYNRGWGQWVMPRDWRAGDRGLALWQSRTLLAIYLSG